MRKIRKFHKQPDNSIISRDLKGEIHYIDSFAIKIADINNYSVDYLTGLLFSSIPGWSRALFKLRNFLVGPFGLETGTLPEEEDIKPSRRYNIGERAILFTVIDRSKSEIVMAEDDKHLYFRTSLYVERNSGLAYLTTIAQFHNFWGRLYFFPVKPFHKLIMKSLLTNFSKALKLKL